MPYILGFAMFACHLTHFQFSFKNQYEQNNEQRIFSKFNVIQTVTKIQPDKLKAYKINGCNKIIFISFLNSYIYSFFSSRSRPTCQVSRTIFIFLTDKMLD